MTEYLPFLMLPVTFGLMFLGVQVAFAMLLTATMFGLATFGPAVVHQFVEKIDDLASNFVFAAIPLFVFMGAMLEKSGIADRPGALRSLRHAGPVSRVHVVRQAGHLVTGAHLADRGDDLRSDLA